MLIEAWMEEFKRETLENYDTEYLQAFLLLGFFDIFALPSFWYVRKKK